MRSKCANPEYSEILQGNPTVSHIQSASREQNAGLSKPDQRLLRLHPNPRAEKASGTRVACAHV
jgi:hypothetical protein